MAKDNLNLFQLGAKGVNVVTAPTHLTPDELTLAQNAEYVSNKDEGALDQRPGMTKVNSLTLTDDLVSISDIPAGMLTDKTATLYAGMYSTATHFWRKSTDGTTWTNDDTLAKPGSNNSLIKLFSKAFPKAVTLGGKMYYFDNASPIQIHQFDGVNDVKITSVPPAIVGTNLSTPVAPTITIENEDGAHATTYTYKLVAIQGTFNSAASSAASTTTGNAALNSTHYNAVVPNDLTPVAGATSYDVYRTAGGGSTGKIGSIPIVGGAFSTGNGSGYVGVTFPTPPTPTMVVTGSGSQTYLYDLVGKYAGGNSLPTQGTVVNGPAFLADPSATIDISASNYNNVTSYDVYRMLGGGSTGLIGTITPASPTLHDNGLTGNGAALPVARSGLALGDPNIFSDGGLVGDASVAPATASGGAAGNAQAVLDMVTDGSALYLAVQDFNGVDPAVYGRIMQFYPTSETWQQIGATFFTASGNGTAGTLAFYDGALSYGGYIGSTAGNTTYTTGTSNPLPAGGIQEVHTFAASIIPISMAVFNGDVYFGCTNLGAVAAIIIKRTSSTAAYATVRTAPAAAATNGWTSLYVFNGKLYAGWTSGNGGTAARIESSIDGVTWVLEYSAAATEMPCQMTSFGGNLYVVLGLTNGGGLTTSRILKYSPSTVTWSVADDPSDQYAGCIATVYV